MPLPTAAEIRDRTKKNSEMREMLAQLVEYEYLKPKILLANSDLNNISSDGFFLVNAQASTIQNLPIAGLGFGFQSTDNLGNKTQWWFNLPTSNYSFRTKWNGEWKAWSTVPNLEQVPIAQSVPAGVTALSQITKVGIYPISSSSSFSDFPSDALSGETYYLTVEAHISGYRMQYLRCASGSKLGQQWERQITLSTGAANNWRFYSGLHDKQILPSNLSDSFRYKGQYTSVKIEDYLADGLYTFVTPTDAPAGASGTTGLVDVQNWYAGTFVLQKWTTLSKLNEVFSRQISSSGVSEWVSASIPLSGNLSGSVTLASYESDGTYTFTTSAVISDLPVDAPTGQTFTMKVEPFLAGRRFKLQRLRCNSGSAYTGLKWERQLDTQNHTVTAWVNDSRLHAGQVLPENLNKSFRYKGTFTSVDISTLHDDGLYTLITPTDAPSGASSTSGLLDVKNWYASTFIIQTWTTASINKVNEIFVRYLRPNTNPVQKGEWLPLGGSGAASSIFAGKKVLCFGDSITEFGTYPQQIGSRLGATGYNVGFGGCRWAKHTNALYDPFSMYRVADYIATENLAGLMDAAIALRDSSQADDNTAQVARLQSLDFTTVDYVTIFYGTNDFAGGTPNPIGTESDTTGDTVKGAINLTLDKLLTKYPNLKIVLVTPIWRARQNTGDGLESDSNPNSLGLYLRDYVEAIKDMGKKYHLPVLDLYNTSGINKYTKNLYLSSDELHPNSAGYTHLANLIASKLSSTF